MKPKRIRTPKLTFSRPLKPRKKTTRIVLHCSATHANQDIDATEIHRWHQERGWVGIGYHLVIKRDGTVELGRDLDACGAHAKGYNHTSIGVCLVGGLRKFQPDTNFTMRQWVALSRILADLRTIYPNATVVGHRDVDPTKACPTFDAGALV